MGTQASSPAECNAHHPIAYLGNALLGFSSHIARYNERSVVRYIPQARRLRSHVPRSACPHTVFGQIGNEKIFKKK